MKTLAIALLMFVASTARADWQREQWVVQPFTWALGGGPSSGPAAGVGQWAHHLCGDARGNRYLINGQDIDIVTADGDRMRLAGSGERGFRDGPAHQSEFRMGEGAYYEARSLACTAGGTVYIADSGNHRVRRLAKESGEWRVTTLAGGDRARPEKGRPAPQPSSVSFSGTLAVAATSSGEVTIADSYGAYRVSADGKQLRYLGPWPASTALTPPQPARLNPMMGDADNVGNAYFVSRTPDVVVKVDAQGGIHHLAGLVVRSNPKPHHIGDVAARDAYFDTPTSLVAAPDGSAVFVCGGDEYAVRRIPTDGKGTTATLLQNGRWAVLSVHPNKVRGNALVRPNATGRARPEGDLTPMTINHLVGRDAQGNMYGTLVRWTGMAPEIEGAGPLPTRVFRLRREASN